MIDLTSESTLKQIFKDENNIGRFWLRVKGDSPSFTKKALDT